METPEQTPPAGEPDEGDQPQEGGQPADEAGASQE